MNSTRIQSILQSYFTEDNRWAHPDRRLVFWYDDNAQFQDIFTELQLPNIEKLELADIPFTTKYNLIVRSPNTSFLLYAPFREPSAEDNWLLDLQKSGLTFSADPAALIYADLGFIQRSLEPTIRKHLNFFNTQRTTALQALQLPANTNDRELTIGMLSVLTHLKSADATLLIRQVLMQGLLETENPLWQEITTLLCAEAFWDTVRDHIGFHSTKPSLRSLMLKILISHLDIGIQGATPTEIKTNVISPPQRAYAFLDQWTRDQQDAPNLKAIITQDIAEELHLFQTLESLPTETLIEGSTFEQIDQILIRRCVKTLLESPPDLDRWRVWLNTRRTLFWSSDYLTTYDALEAAIHLTELKQQYNLSFTQPAPQMFEAYATRLYKFDTAYRHFIVASDKAKPILRNSGLIEHVENIYVNGFLSNLGQHWSDALRSSPTFPQWELPTLPLQTNFFQSQVQGIIDRNDREKVFVIISDALRYEVAAELQEKLIKEVRGDATLTAQLSPLPSITRLGMASLLPGRDLEFLPKSGDVLRDNKSTQGIKARNTTLQANSRSEAIALSAAELLSMTIDQGREVIKPNRIIYIYHDVIDAIGDKAASERQVFDACETAIEEIIKLTKRICNSLNGTHVIITADHGFLYQRDSINPNDKLIMPKDDEILETNRRYLVSHQPLEISGTLSFQIPYSQEKLFITVPRGSVRFALQGRGAQYVHGGASLQEVCVPALAYHHKRAIKNDDGPAKKVGVQVNARTRTVTNNRFRISLMQLDTIAGRWRSRRVTIGLYDPKTQDPITDIKHLELNSPSQNPTEREFPIPLTVTITNPPSTAHLIVRDEEDDSELVNETWTVSIGIINDFGDF